MTTTKRAYKLPHASSVNCLKIGRKSSRVLVTGGEDHKVNLWAIGKPNAILSLSGHSSGIDSVSFDSSEVLVAAGAASGTIKLWDLEEAKIVRTLTGHRSNCISLDFHPFGEFFASGSLDTNLKIWDIRRKGCIHTYKGHTRGVNAIRFTPDGRWVVSGGEDNSVKLWDLTAGKLLHEFKYHEGQVQCIDFHPHEFLMATGSADKTVKFWDLETLELIGSAGPETSGVRCMTFNPDGRTLLCGLHESLKVYSWEPIRTHDAVDVGWSKLSDLNMHEGKLLGCSYNQSCVGVWVVDISRIEPYSVPKLNGHKEQISNSSGSVSVLTENTTKTSLNRISVPQSSDPIVKETKSFGRLSITQNSELNNKDSKTISSTGNVPGISQKTYPNVVQKISPTSSGSLPSAPAASKRSYTKSQPTQHVSSFSRVDVAPVIVPRNNLRSEQALDSRREGISGRMTPTMVMSKTTDSGKLLNVKDEAEKPLSSSQSVSDVSDNESSRVADRNTFTSMKSSAFEIPTKGPSIEDDRCAVSGRPEQNVVTKSQPSFPTVEIYEGRQPRNRDNYTMENTRRARTRPLVSTRDRRERPLYNDPLPSRSLSDGVSAANVLPNTTKQVSEPTLKETQPVTEDDIIADIMGRHDQFVSSMQSRLAKLQMIQRCWDRNDIKGAIRAMERMSDHSVTADIVSLLAGKIETITLDICTCLLPLLTSLLDSDMDRHRGVSLELLLKLVRVFGSGIYSSLHASASVGVDIEAEQRLERYKLCYQELEKVKRCLPLLTRRGGTVAKSAQELNLALQEVS
ncbi:transducin/WD40 repeat-like superfamily protein [Artemisia annua]|uniref:Katanin p80 WD40 repeat-containing subunit B1 homolog n=1 Tax=Artemisia annua TaxID=35608 RepID=A0A2U1PWJ0_ARTAN|nr:transducin/WD40 repeat-like superfamily protein [Artemisia annua]